MIHVYAAAPVQAGPSFGFLHGSSRRVQQT